MESVCVIVIKGKVECEGREERLKNTEGVFFFKAVLGSYVV